MRNKLKRLWRYMEGVNGLLFILCVTFIFAAQAFFVTGVSTYFLRWLLLILVLTLFLREKIRNKDEVALGLTFTLVGMILLTSGIKLGLGSLGGEVGSQLPKAFASEEKFVEQVVINNFDSTMLYSGISPEGENLTFFNLECYIIKSFYSVFI